MLVSVCVVERTASKGIVLIKDWSIISTEDISTLLDVFNQVMVDRETPENVTVACSIGKDKMAGDGITMQAVVGESVQLFGRYLKFTVARSEQDGIEGNFGRPSGSTPVNAFDVMMTAQRKAQTGECLPQKYNITRPNSRFELHNDFIDKLEKEGLSFSPTSVKNCGENFVHAVTDTLWLIDPHLPKLAARGCHLPPFFTKFKGYNDPVVQKHVVKQLDRQKLTEQASILEAILDQTWILADKWNRMRKAMAELADMTQKYCKYLEDKNKEVVDNQKASETVRRIEDFQVVTTINPKHVVKPTFLNRYHSLRKRIIEASDFEVIDLQDFVPQTAQDRRYYINNLEQGMPARVVHYRVAYGNNEGTYHFLWKSPMGDNEMKASSINMQQIISGLPTFHTRAMRKKFISTCSTITPSVKPAYLRHIYKSLTGDASVSNTEAEKAIDERVKQAFDMEDLDIIVDLREHNCGRPEKYGVFFEKTKQYLENIVETAADERRHSEITHMATAISAPDLLRQVSETCLPGTPIPTEQWLRLQFAPKNPSSISSLQHTGVLDVKYAIQSRQFRMSHDDDHYASALFRYEKEFAIKFKEYTNFVCADDKHHAKVGEPGNPVAAVERGRRVVTTNGIKFVVSDHDFTKFSIIPSVNMLLDIPDDITGSFHRGQVYVAIKDQVFEPSTPLRHATELMFVLESENVDKPILCLYTDGGPDHRVTYLSVKLALLCVFLARDLDLLLAVRTPPRSSWKNPPERIMATLNMGMQAVGLERKPMDQQNERAIKSSSTLKGLRDQAADNEELKAAMCDSIEPVKVLMNSIIQRLYLKEKQFKAFAPAKSEDMDRLWGILGRYGNVDVEKKQKELQKAVDSSPELKELLGHCTTSRQYFFCIKKCGEESCSVCHKPRLPPDIFEKLHVLPDPVPEDEQHYKPFQDVYGTDTTEDFRPSLEAKATQGHQLPFSPSAQTANTVKRVLECTDCDKPRVVYAARMLSKQDLNNLDKLFRFYQYSCGSTLADLITPDNKTPIVNALLKKVFVRANLMCSSPIEVPYYTSKSFKDLCYFCGSFSNLVLAVDIYPCCQSCLNSKKEKDKPYVRKRNIFSAAKAKITAKKRRK